MDIFCDGREHGSKDLIQTTFTAQTWNALVEGDEEPSQ